MDKTLTLIAIILLLLSGFSIEFNKFKFEWIGLLDKREMEEIRKENNSLKIQNKQFANEIMQLRFSKNED